MLRLAPPLTIALFAGPVVIGLAGTLLPALGWLPGVGRVAAPGEVWGELLATPGLARALALTCVSGLGGTALALLAAVAITAAMHGRRLERLVRGLLPPLLAVPHLASAIGTAFLIAPSGWASRLVSPWLTGWTVPPDLLTVQDPWGLALLIGLVIREAPFLLLALAAARPPSDPALLIAAGRSLGHGPAEAWLKLVLPQLYAQIRLPLYAVLAFSLSVVDMAIVLGPSAPPVLAVQLLRWFTDPDLSRRTVAAAGAILQLGLILAAIGLWRLGELAVARAARRWLVGGASPVLERGVRVAGALAGGLVIGGGLAGLLVLGLWSVAQRWRFPQAWPQAFSLDGWLWAAQGLAGPAVTTVLLGLGTAGLALALVLASVEQESRAGPRATCRMLTLAYLPLLVPQISFLFGLQALLVRLNLDATAVGLAWAHLVFVLPYVILMLRAPYLALGRRLPDAGRTLGVGPGALFWRVKLPLLARPIAVALAIGFSVSVAQYLPTVFAGAGRYATLTTEALGLALGGDRRLTAAAGLLLAALPLAVLAAALALPSPGARGRDRERR